VNRLFRFGFFAVLACGSSAAATLAVTIGGETDTITRSPAVDDFIIEAVDHQGNRQSLMDGSAKWSSGSTLTLGELPQATVASIQLTGFEADGGPVVWGAVPFAELGAFSGLTIPLFVQRKGDTARMPGTIEAGSPPLLAANSRVILVAGDNTTLGAYDMLYLDAISSVCPSAATKSFALVVSPTPNSDGEQAMAWRISDNAASVYGLAQCTGDYGVNVHPQDGGFVFSDFAGGRTVMDGTGPYSTAYVVGPSRTSGMSGVVFKITPDSEASTAIDAVISTIALTPRKGAATAWAPGYGLFIYGGASAAPGDVGEIVNTSGGVQEIPVSGDASADTREGLAAIAFDAKKMLVAGDGQTPILVDLSCPDCPPQQWGAATNVPLSSPSLFSIGNGAFVLVGDDSTGATRVFRLSDSDAAPPEKPLKIPRQGARAIQFETGQIVFIGGGSATPESYVD
jgi:hypothetical protein